MSSGSLGTFAGVFPSCGTSPRKISLSITSCFKKDCPTSCFSIPLQFQSQPLRSDLEAFRRQSPNRRPSLRASVPQVSSQHCRLAAHARRQLSQPRRDALEDSTRGPPSARRATASLVGRTRALSSAWDRAGFRDRAGPTGIPSAMTRAPSELCWPGRLIR